MPTLFDRRRVPRDRSSFQRAPNNALASLAIKQNCGILLTKLHTRYGDKRGIGDTSSAAARSL